MSESVFCDDFDAKAFLGSLARDLQRAAEIDKEQPERVILSNVNIENREAWEKACKGLEQCMKKQKK